MIRRWFIGSALVVGMLAVPGASNAGVCDGSLSASPQPTWSSGAMTDVGSTAKAGRWAVGVRTEFVGADTHEYAISEHWDGVQWVKVQMAYARAFEPKSLAVLGDRAWAAGRGSDPSTNGDVGSMIERWNGSSWRRASVPAVLVATSTRVWAIDGSSRHDIWAGGSTITNGRWRMVMIHWDGSTWTRVPAPLPYQVDTSYGVVVADIAVDSPDSAWAVGYANPFGRQSFAMHWDGSGWSIVNPSVPDAPSNNWLNAIAASDGDVWAVGSADMTSLVLRWSGTGWTREPSPDAGFDTDDLEDVTVGSSVLVGGSGWNSFPPTPNPEYFRWVEPGGREPLNTTYSLTSLDLTGGVLLGVGWDASRKAWLVDGCLA